MKIAIVGAGISGLSCAIGLKRHGVIPDVFERKSHIGAGMNFMGGVFRQFHHNRKDPLCYVNKRYNLKLIPNSSINNLTMIGPNHTSHIKGKLGYMFKRGEESGSLENQLAAYAKVPVRFDTYADAVELAKEYDAVIAATGDDKVAKQLGIWNVRMNTQCRVATVLGEFDPSALTMWINNDYTKHGFCFMAAVTQKQAYIHLIVNAVTSEELDCYWKRFIEAQQLSVKIILTTDHEENNGYASKLKERNIIFTGNSAGMLDTAVGFGAFNAIESGFMAADSILGKGDYEKMTRPIRKYVDDLCHIRTLINNFNNKCFGRFIALLGFPGLKQLIYKAPLFRIRDVMPGIKLYNRISGSRGGCGEDAE